MPDITHDHCRGLYRGCSLKQDCDDVGGRKEPDFGNNKYRRGVKWTYKNMSIWLVALRE